MTEWFKVLGENKMMDFRMSVSPKHLYVSAQHGLHVGESNSMLHVVRKTVKVVGKCFRATIRRARIRIDTVC